VVNFKGVLELLRSRYYEGRGQKLRDYRASGAYHLRHGAVAPCRPAVRPLILQAMPL